MDKSHDDRARSGLIGRLRNLLHRQELERAQLDLNHVIEETGPVPRP